MPILTTVRQSPAYLYLKTYCLCSIISLFQAAPVSSTIDQIGDLPLLKNSQIQNLRIGVKNPGVQPRTSVTIQLKKADPSKGNSRPRIVLKRWVERAVDLAQVKKLLRRDDKDLRTYPELNWDASVRRSSALHPQEEQFIQLRKRKISSQGSNSLHKFLELSEGEIVDPRDVPLIALGGSGGGYRAMYGFAATISAAKKLRLWDCLTWTAGVSGSCWTVAAYYTIANHDASKLMKHYLLMATEMAHPMSLQALNTVARTSKGIYFLIGPLIRKVRSGIIGLGIMDLYGTLTTAYQLLSREPGSRLSRATFQFSKVWTRSGIDQGIEPMPIFTAVRRAPKDLSGVKPHSDSSLSKGTPPTRALLQHQTKGANAINGLQNTQVRHMEPAKQSTKSLPPNFFQWFEISPLEVGSSTTQSYIPTWSWGRTFASGTSVGRPPEQSLSLILGQCTSAPAGPLTGYISALLATIPKGTIMSRLLLLLNDFVRMKKWESLWGNPIRAGHDPNPFYGHNDRPEPQIDEEKIAGRQTSDSNGVRTPPRSKPKWEPQGRIRLMDSGMSNNLPNHILARPERCADIIIAFDASSDVQTGSAVQRIQNFADDCNLQLEDYTALFETPEPMFQARLDVTKCARKDVETKFLHQYVRVFQCKRENGQVVYLIYCPLLPNGRDPVLILL